MPVWKWIRARPWTGLAIGIVGAIAILAGSVMLAEPRLDRHWVENLSRMPKVELSRGSFALDHVTDWSYTDTAPKTKGARTFANTFDELRNVWFVVEPQPGQPYAAHTLILFEFGGDRIVGLTVEARLEDGETYDAVQGALNKFELSYVWSTARDLLTRRVTMLHKQIYVYPLQLDDMQKRSFLRALIEQTVDVSTHARFYNTITSNCTNELAKVAGLGWHYSWVLTGYSPQRLYELKLIPGATFEAAQQHALLTAPVASWNAMETPDFDRALLTELRSRNS
ncbi:MAG: DUF4105 domain-containing protein [Hyphomonadaceae bacterium]